MKINKQFKVDDVKILDESEGVVEAFVNTMGMVDKDNDIISPSAFDKSILNNLPLPVLAGHDQSSLVGKVVSARSQPITTDEYQLYAKMQMNMDTQAGREAFSNVSGNYIREWSVGFNVPDPESDIEFSENEGKTIRTIKNLDWVEVSAVIRGASPMTSTISAKSQTDEPEIRRESQQDDITATDTTDDVALDTDMVKQQLEITRLRLKLKNNKSEE
jgi:HK97 family phage prohead protease